MKKPLVFLLAFVIGIVFTVAGFAQEKKPAESVSPAIKTEAPAPQEKQASGKKLTKKKHHKKKHHKKKKHHNKKHRKSKRAAKPVSRQERPAEDTTPATPAK